MPEFVVGDLATSLCFWCDVLGFRVAYQRSEDNFAYLERGRAQVMLEVSEATGRPATGSARSGVASIFRYSSRAFSR